MGSSENGETAGYDFKVAKETQCLAKDAIPLLKRVEQSVTACDVERQNFGERMEQKRKTKQTEEEEEQQNEDERVGGEDEQREARPLERQPRDIDNLSQGWTVDLPEGILARV